MPHPPGPGHVHEHGHDHVHARDVHQNPVDFDSYVARLDDPERDAWQHADRVVAALRLAPGARAAEIGSGVGTFVLRMADVVGPTGRVYAVDVEPRLLAILRDRATARGLAQVVPLLSDGDAVPPEPCDRILLVNAFHHLPDGVGALRRLAGALRPGGSVVLVDFHGGELPLGPPPEHRLSREASLARATEAGLRLVHEETFLPYQYWLELAPA